MAQNADRTSVLFVDDEESIRLTLSAVLQGQGFDVTAVATVGDALTQINCCRYDVLLCDLNIEKPGDGFTVIGAMRYSQPQCLSLVLTAYPSFENAMHALRHQVDEFFTKPADIAYLVQSIRKRLGGQRSKVPVPFKALAAILRENCEVIVQSAAGTLKSDPILGRTHSGDDYAAAFSGFMDALIEYVEVGRNGLESEVLKVGTHHGRKRKKQGYDARMVVREFQLLEEQVCRLIASAPLGVTPEFAKFMKGLNVLVMAALKPYVTTPDSGQSPSRRSILKGR